MSNHQTLEHPPFGWLQVFGQYTWAVASEAHAWYSGLGATILSGILLHLLPYPPFWSLWFGLLIWVLIGGYGVARTERIRHQNQEGESGRTIESLRLLIEEKKFEISRLQSTLAAREFTRVEVQLQIEKFIHLGSMIARKWSDGDVGQRAEYEGWLRMVNEFYPSLKTNEFELLRTWEPISDEVAGELRDCDVSIRNSKEDMVHLGNLRMKIMRLWRVSEMIGKSGT